MPTRTITVLIALVAALGCPTSEGADGPQKLTGNVWQTMPRAMRLTYVTATVDAWALAEIVARVKLASFPPSAASIELAPRCLDHERSFGQYLAIVDKWLADHPDLWHEPLSGLVYWALDRGCP